MRRGRRIPIAGCADRANAGDRQESRRPEGFRAEGRLASLFLSRRPTRGILLRRASPPNLLHENRTLWNFKTGSKLLNPQPHRRKVRRCFFLLFRSEQWPGRNRLPGVWTLINLAPCQLDRAGRVLPVRTGLPASPPPASEPRSGSLPPNYAATSFSTGRPGYFFSEGVCWTAGVLRPTTQITHSSFLATPRLRSQDRTFRQSRRT